MLIPTATAATKKQQINLKMLPANCTVARVCYWYNVFGLGGIFRLLDVTFDTVSDIEVASVHNSVE